MRLPQTCLYEFPIPPPHISLVTPGGKVVRKMPDSSREDIRDENIGEKTSQEETRPRTRSLRSWRTGRSRTRSRPRSTSRPASLTRIYSAGFHDDHGVYIEPSDFAGGSPAATVPPANATSEDSDGVEKERQDDEALEEVESRDFDRRPTDDNADRAAENGDLEKAPPLSRRETSKSTKSQRERDPNMVSWNGPDDPRIPKIGQ